MICMFCNLEIQSPDDTYHSYCTACSCHFIKSAYNNIISKIYFELSYNNKDFVATYYINTDEDISLYDGYHLIAKFPRFNANPGNIKSILKWIPFL
jgi:hypothetical protein